jgi:hypothetical protein
MMRAIGVGDSGGVEDDRSRVAAGCCPEVVEKSFFPSLEQGKLRATESKLLASAYSTASLSHW